MSHPADTPAAGGQAPEPPVLLFCIGAQKAGTTWLFSQLGKRPDVFLARPKELHYWNVIRAPYMREFRLRTRQRLHLPEPRAGLKQRLAMLWNARVRDREALAARYDAIYQGDLYDHAAYLRYVGAERRGVRLIGDITPAYALLGRETYREMAACHPDVRFVFIMRDPVHRLWSGLGQRHQRALRRNAISDASLGRAFAAACGNPLDPDFLRSDYPRTIGELEAAVPAARIHHCFFETLLDPERGGQERRALAGFLGLDDLQMDVGERVHGSERRPALPDSWRDSAEAALSPVYQALRRRFGDRIPATWLAGKG